MPWLPTGVCDPPHRISHPEKYLELMETFRKSGWDPAEPALVGYVLDGRVQLLSGSHRWAAARDAGIAIPVVLRRQDMVVDCWGFLELWREYVMAAPAASTIS